MLKTQNLTTERLLLSTAIKSLPLCTGDVKVCGVFKQRLRLIFYRANNKYDISHCKLERLSRYKIRQNIHKKQQKFSIIIEEQSKQPLQISNLCKYAGVACLGRLTKTVPTSVTVKKAARPVRALAVYVEPTQKSGPVIPPPSNLNSQYVKTENFILQYSNIYNKQIIKSSSLVHQFYKVLIFFFEFRTIFLDLGNLLEGGKKKLIK